MSNIIDSNIIDLMSEADTTHSWEEAAKGWRKIAEMNQATVERSQVTIDTALDAIRRATKTALDVTETLKQTQEALLQAQEANKGWAKYVDEIDEKIKSMLIPSSPPRKTSTKTTRRKV